jgi:hypothetical protein
MAWKQFLIPWDCRSSRRRTGDARVNAAHPERTGRKLDRKPHRKDLDCMWIPPLRREERLPAKTNNHRNAERGC